ncbi:MULTISPECIES: MarR family winged helix-turn-helix transcriptional regulator [Dyella]|uniref:MarR family winged helix-turn-helix transcriptional regulator n=1 Tax=Dyella TaxID=231454 RepID=UPI000C82ED53|nr:MULTISPECIES: MarR family transcriptional regulator [Dyella]PMQ05135.1 Multiple antibiotic resistance protein MarR [Dyella sp. AD56]ULU25757.1 MarR family transcriptional regulator [Dyella terrae]
MSRHPTSGSEADHLWQMLVSLVWETRGEWRRQVSEVTGLPFSRVRVLRRLIDAPVTLKQLADMTSSDAPATTVAVNDLEDRGLVQRQPHPDNRRAKLVSLTPAGRKLIELMHRTVRDDAPAAVQQLSDTDLAHLRRILEKIQRHEP